MECGVGWEWGGKGGRHPERGRDREVPRDAVTHLVIITKLLSQLLGFKILKSRSCQGWILLKVFVYMCLPISSRCRLTDSPSLHSLSIKSSCMSLCAFCFVYESHWIRAHCIHLPTYISIGLCICISIQVCKYPCMYLDMHLYI